jgi:hypothetical protein
MEERRRARARNIRRKRAGGVGTVDQGRSSSHETEKAREREGELTIYASSPTHGRGYLLI